ncbi:uncharacterized protein EI90DRAFT_3073869, partial [Cantharellus anzutake]|uniref:uncharacterized protein n=1 Tax=Cantharellus anzutake TaxID=1750568 RepID=UPI00190429F2
TNSMFLFLTSYSLWPTSCFLWKFFVWLLVSGFITFSCFLALCNLCSSPSCSSLSLFFMLPSSIPSLLPVVN